MNVYKITYNVFTKMYISIRIGIAFGVDKEIVKNEKTMLIAAPKLSIPLFESIIKSKVVKAEIYDEDVFINECRVWKSEKDYKSEFYK